MCSGPDCVCHSSSQVALYELTLIQNQLGMLDLDPLCSHLVSKLHTMRLRQPSEYVPEICDSLSHVTIKDKSKVTRDEMETLMNLMYNKCRVKGQKSRDQRMVKTKTHVEEMGFKTFSVHRLEEKKKEREMSELFAVNCQLEDIEESVCGILTDLVMANI